MGLAHGRNWVWARKLTAPELRHIAFASAARTIIGVERLAVFIAAVLPGVRVLGNDTAARPSLQHACFFCSPHKAARAHAAGPSERRHEATIATYDNAARANAAGRRRRAGEERRRGPAWELGGLARPPLSSHLAGQALYSA